jgi:hypothetical protein
MAFFIKAPILGFPRMHNDTVPRSLGLPFIGTNVDSGVRTKLASFDDFAGAIVRSLPCPDR